MTAIHELGNGMKVTYCPAIPATRNHYGTFAHYKYYARKSKKFHNDISYQKLCEWTRQVSDEVRTTFEHHFNSEMKKDTKWGIMVHPDSQKTIRELKSRDVIKNVRIALVFTAETDIHYTSTKYDHLIRAYFYVDNLE